MLYYNPMPYRPLAVSGGLVARLVLAAALVGLIWLAVLWAR